MVWIGRDRNVVLSVPVVRYTTAQAEIITDNSICLTVNESNLRVFN